MFGVDPDVQAKPNRDETGHIEIRAMTPGDADALQRMFFRMSPETVYRRFFRPIHRPSPAALRYLTNVDHHDREALVAVAGEEIVGVARYDRLRNRPRDAEVAVVVEDAWQRRGLGHRLVRRLADIASGRDIDAFTAEVLGGNRAAVDLVRCLAPTADIRFEGGEVVVRAPLTPTAA